jgi:hypothetical protein
VRASAEGLYSSLINDKFFIDLNNVFADLLKAIDGIFDALGGLKTFLPLIAGLILKTFGPSAIGAVGGFMSSLQGPTKEQQAAAMQTRADVMKE